MKNQTQKITYYFRELPSQSLSYKEKEVESLLEYTIDRSTCESDSHVMAGQEVLFMENQTAETTCYFRGLRSQFLPYEEKEVKSVLEYAIDRAINENYSHFLTGMERDFETWAAEIVLQRREKNPNITLQCYLPYSTLGQRWSKAERQRLQAVLQAADEVISLQSAFDYFAYFQQCQAMRENAGLGIVFYEARSCTTLGDFFRFSDGETMKLWNVLNVMREGLGNPALYDALLDKGYISPRYLSDD